MSKKTSNETLNRKAIKAKKAGSEGILLNTLRKVSPQDKYIGPILDIIDSKEESNDISNNDIGSDEINRHWASLIKAKKVGEQKQLEAEKSLAEKLRKEQEKQEKSQKKEVNKQLKAYSKEQEFLAKEEKRKEKAAQKAIDDGYKEKTDYILLAAEEIKDPPTVDNKEHSLNSPKVLHKTKQIIDKERSNESNKFGNNKGGNKTKVRDLTEMSEELKKVLKKNIHFKKGIKIEAPRFKLQDFMRAGYDDALNKNVTWEDIAKKLKSATPKQHEGYKIGFMNKWKDATQKNLAGSESPQAARAILSSENRKKVNAVLGYTESENFTKTLQNVTDLIKNTRHYRTGSPTAQRAADVIEGTDIARTINNPKRSFWGAIGKVLNKYSDMMKNEEAREILEMTIKNPERLRTIANRIAEYDKYSKSGKMIYRHVPSLATRLMMRKPEED